MNIEYTKTTFETRQKLLKEEEPKLKRQKRALQKRRRLSMNLRGYETDAKAYLPTC